ncbi:MAG: DUF2330 domain-containing protein [Chloroflexi bacterium]|nr:DUF2330 domain-containing protein [Chloroflexota bacterium]
MFIKNPLWRVGQMLGVVLLLALVFSASTAYACGCGIYIPRDGDAQVAQERSLLRWDGTREMIVMSLGVLGGSKQAAIILPVPSKADVQLADAKIFDELDELTKPLERQETEWVFMPVLGAGARAPEGVGGAPPVTVLSRQNLGPFDVANLAATDAAALKTWLDENGFALDPRTTEILAPNIEKNWTFVAVRVQPEQASLQLQGDLAPLAIAFDSLELVYPMRSTALADNQQTVVLYVLADHRVEKSTSFGSSRVSYANWLEPSSLASNSTLAPFVERKYFLTKYIDSVNPNQVNDDFKFSFASQDTPYREVKIRTVRQDVSGLVLLACRFGWLLRPPCLVWQRCFGLDRRM